MEWGISLVLKPHRDDVTGRCPTLCWTVINRFASFGMNFKVLLLLICSYHPGSHEISCYNVVAAETAATGLPSSVLSHELALPVVPSCFVTRSQAALHLLGCLDTLTQAQDRNMVVREDTDERQPGCGKVYSREDFSAVTRFESEYCLVCIYVV